MPPGSWITRANALTALRLLSAPLLAAFVAHGARRSAALVFALAVATDLLDGRVARRRGEASPLGGALDHAVDATFVTVGVAALAGRGILPVWLAPAIALAFAQYALDSRVLAGAGLRGSALGRWNGIAYYVIVGIPVVRDALALGFPGPAPVMALGWLLVLTTAVSMADRARLLLRARRSRGSRAAGRRARSPH
jgi:phosphatidylglycerophosphate synthase